MKAFFVKFNTAMSSQMLTARLRRLRRLLDARKIELSSIKVGSVDGSVLDRIVARAKGRPVIVLDDSCSLPAHAPWMADLQKKLADVIPASRPRIVYLTCSSARSGRSRNADKELIRGYVQRDETGRWVDAAAALVEELASEQRAVKSACESTSEDIEPPIVGQSVLLRRAIEGLESILGEPYGLVTGDSGVGKMYIIRSLWRQIAGADSPFMVLPCGSFFKDYYVMGLRRRVGGGRSAVDELWAYLEEANTGLLVLHHIHLTPTALQEELLGRLAAAGTAPGREYTLRGIDNQKLSEHRVALIGSTPMSIEELRQSGRLIPELMRKLTKRHVRIPTLAERGEGDIRLLCQDIVLRICATHKIVPPIEIGKAAMTKMCQTHWRNNISDLTAVLEQAIRKCRDRIIRKKHLPSRLISDAPQSGPTLDEIVAGAQRAAILNALEAAGGSITIAAAALGRNRAGLHRLMRKLGIPPVR
jgi:anaerobic nitric oxide reductase transcription regulator